MTPESLREAIRERKALAEAAHRPDLRPAWWNGGRGVVGLRAEVNTFIAAHDPSFMLRVYREMEKTLDRHKLEWIPTVYDDEGSSATCSHDGDLNFNEDWSDCPDVRSVAAMLGLTEEP